MNQSVSGPVLRIANLHKSYGRHRVLRGLQLEVASGAVHGLVGLNGCGKTTTLECVLGLQAFDDGSISVLGQRPSHIHLNQGKVVAIFDSPSLNPSLTVDQTLQHAALLCGQPLSRIAEVKELLGIQSFGSFRIRQLSLGNKRRTSIAHGLLGAPELVVLDEPFNGLDAGGVDEVLTLISRLNRQLGTSFLLSSHQLPYLEQICSHLAILHEGQIAVSGSKAELLERVGAVLRLRVSDPAQAQRLLTSETRLKVVQSADQQLLTVEIGDRDPAEINAILVKAGVAVSALIPERSSLDSLFRQVVDRTANRANEAVTAADR